MKVSRFLIPILLFLLFNNQAVGQVSSPDSLVLVNLFDALNVEAQECLNWNENNFRNPITDWEGVILVEEDFEEAPTSVSGLILNDKCIKGTFPAIVNQLTGLDSLSARSNEITTLPDFEFSSFNKLDFGGNQIRVLPNLPSSIGRLTMDNNKLRSLELFSDSESFAEIDILNVAKNELTFEDLSGAIQSESVLLIEDYSRQKSLGDYDYYLYEGLEMELDLYPESITDPGNNYEWEKEGLQIITEGEQIVFLEDLSLLDTGIYRLVVTNSSFPDLTLEGSIRIQLEDKNNMPFDTTTVILKYPLDVTPEEVAEQQAELEREGWSLLRECWCGGRSAPRLQLYLGNDKTLIDLNTLRSKKKVKVATDTTELNYFLINNPIIGVTPTVSCNTPAIDPTRWETNVKVAVIDSGCDPNHIDLRSRFWQNLNPNSDGNCLSNDTIGYDFTNDRPLIVDVDGHGTHVMGSISNDFPADIQLEVINLKVFENGSGLLFDLVCAMNYAVDMEAQVTNISLGYYAEKPSVILYESLRRAKESGMIIAVSSGNEGLNLDSLPRGLQRWPANFKILEDQGNDIQPLDNLIVVGALNGTQDSLATFSNYGTVVDIAAPGTAIRSTSPENDYSTLSGTSMATAFVTNVAAIMRANDQTASYASIIECIQQSTAPFILSERVSWNGKLDRRSAFQCFGLSSYTSENSNSERPRTISMFPNPFSGSLNIVLEDGNAVFEDVHFTVSRLDGSPIYHERCATNRIQWDGKDQSGRSAPRGIYFVRVQVGISPPFILKAFRLKR